MKSGVNFINVLQLDWILTLLGATGVKAVHIKYVGEIEPCSSELIYSIFSLSRLYPYRESLSHKIFLPKCSRWCHHHPIHLRPFLRLPYTTAATAPFPSSTPCRAHLLQRWCSLVRQWYQLLERCNPDLDQWAASCHLPFKCTIPSWFRLIR